jgi:hypothetical protein
LARLALPGGDVVVAADGLDGSEPSESIGQGKFW